MLLTTPIPLHISVNVVQAFVTRVVGDQEQNFLRLAVGKRSQLCPVHENFRLIAVTEKEHAYDNLDLPLLNRLEKQLLEHADVCAERDLTRVVRDVDAFMAKVLGEVCGNAIFPGLCLCARSKLVQAAYQPSPLSRTLTCSRTGLQCGTSTDAPNVGHFFPGYHTATIASLVLAARDGGATTDDTEGFDADRFREELVQRIQQDPLAGLTRAIKESPSQIQLKVIADVIKERGSDLPEDATAQLRVVYKDHKRALTCRKVLAHCATPLAILKSKSMRQACGSLFEDPSTGEVTQAQVHDSLGSFLRHHLRVSATAVSPEERAQEGGSACTFSLIMSRSPSSHLEVALAAIDTQDPSELSGVAITRLQLADFESERAFQGQIRGYFQQETADETMLIVQCDPFLTPSILIDHARYICRDEGERSKRQPLLACSSEFQELLLSDSNMSRIEYAGHVWQKGFVPLFPRHVIFVLHVPLGIAKRAREFPLTFENGWDRLFIDDLLVEDADVSTIKLLRQSVLEISESSIEYELKSFVGQSFMGALAIVIHPQQPTDSNEYHACLFPQRIATFRSLLQSDRFVELLANDVRGILQQYCEDHFTEGLHTHVHIAMGKAGRMGTLRQALVGAIHTIIHAATATAIARIDRNYNLRVLQSEKVPPDLWYAMATLRHQGRHQMAEVKDTTFTVAVKNDGQHGPHCCRFPFSYVCTLRVVLLTPLPPPTHVCV